MTSVLSSRGNKTRQSQCTARAGVADGGYKNEAPTRQLILTADTPRNIPPTLPVSSLIGHQKSGELQSHNFAFEEPRLCRRHGALQPVHEKETFPFRPQQSS